MFKFGYPALLGTCRLVQSLYWRLSCSSAAKATPAHLQDCILHRRKMEALIKKSPASSLEEAGHIPGNDLLSRGLSPNYHRRGSVSLPGSEWDRVVPLRSGHQRPGVRWIIQPTNTRPLATKIRPLPDIHVKNSIVCPASDLCILSVVVLGIPDSRSRERRNQAYRMISTGKLNPLLDLHHQPINVVVYHDPQGEFILGGAWRLDAFSAYLFRT